MYKKNIECDSEIKDRKINLKKNIIYGEKKVFTNKNSTYKLEI